MDSICHTEGVWLFSWYRFDLWCHKDNSNPKVCSFYLPLYQAGLCRLWILHFDILTSRPYPEWLKDALWFLLPLGTKWPQYIFTGLMRLLINTNDSKLLCQVPLPTSQLVKDGERVLCVCKPAPQTHFMLKPKKQNRVILDRDTSSFPSTRLWHAFLSYWIVVCLSSVRMRLVHKCTV